MTAHRIHLRSDLTRVEILALLGTAGALDRRQIATRLRLGDATVHEHTRRLLASGYLRTLAPQAGVVGRPRIPLQVVPEAAATVGVRVATDHLVTVVAGLDGRMISSDVSPFDCHADPIPQLLAVINHRLADPVVGSRLKAVGVATPSSVDPATGFIRFCPRFGWTDLPLGERLRAELAIPVLVDNDLRASTTAELLYRTGLEHDDFLVLGIGDGVGLGAVLHRRVHRGPSGLSGEFGHTPVAATGPRCACGARGCLETFTSDHGILRAARRRGLAEAATTIEELRARWASREPGLADLLAEIGAILGRAVAGVVNLLGTPTITVIGENHVLWPGLEPGFSAAMRTSQVTAAHRVRVIVRPWSDAQHALGAASLALAAPETLA
ncbi:ROK family protein [Nonomuraea sp. SYSU D8015]|uniref:ROK family protein n=1 Tax=Nonomuraea sp. SYSU D8015 TaxID=2593644 RepID=UPI001660F1EB|nr:ROK family protein [Nonomuraea sp. SYSU D8015]